MRTSTIAAAILGGAMLMLTGCASMDQQDNEVYRRESGGTLKPWLSLAEASQRHWPYAWASVSAYLHAEDGRQLPSTQACPAPEAVLPPGWVRWDELPRLGRNSPDPADPAARQIKQTHLRAIVWSSQKDNTVIVAFGGTAGHWEDVKANAHWFLRPFGVKDAYDALTGAYVPLFVKAYLARQARPEWAWLKGARVVSTGHSLGGGLAQRFAYSLDAAQGVPAVKEVYAFDPSPVSGKRSVAGFEERAKGLTIYRIYSRGEILASLRSLLHIGNPGNERNQGQTWIDIRYYGHWSWRTLLPDGWIRAHGMHDLACLMRQSLQGEQVLQ